MRLPLFLALLALPAFAQGTPNPGAVARLLEAHRLYQLGQSAHDPILLLAAARLMQGVTLREVTRTEAEPLPEPEDAKKPKDKTKDAAEPAPVPLAPPTPKIVPDPANSAPLPGALDPKTLLAEARGMAPNTGPLHEVIADAETEVPPPGAVAQVTSLLQPAGESTTFSLPLAGQSYAEIGLLRLSTGSAPDATSQGRLTLTVTDATGNAICADASATTETLCGIIPAQTGAFRVTITNDGTAPAAYLLITN